MLNPVRRARCLSAFFCLWFLALLLCSHCEGQGNFSVNGFEVGEQVELVRDEILLFNQTPFRKGLKGEQFQVAAHASGKQRVFLMSKNEQGALIALNVPELAVRRIAKDWIGLNYKTFELLRDGKIDEAQKALFYLASVDPERAVCGEIASSLDRLQKATTAQKMLLRQYAQVQVEVAKKLKNAASANMPSLLTKQGDADRAERYTREAQQLESAARRAIEENISTMKRNLDALNEVANKLEILKSYTEASSLHIFVDLFAASELKDKFRTGNWNMALMRAAAESSRIHVANAQKSIIERRLTDASEHVASGMKVESGSYALRKLREEIHNKMELVLECYGKALEMRENKQFESALNKIESSLSVGVDYKPTQKLITELRQIISEKDALISKAKVSESLRDYEAALKVYETYALLPDRNRVLALLGAKREEEGNYIAAYDIFESLGKTDEMKRILGLRETQEAEYLKARFLLAEGKYQEAAAIYQRFHDSAMEKDMQIRHGAWLEGQAKFDEAISFYKSAGLAEELQKLKTFVNERENLILQGIEQEKAGNYDRAIGFFKNANVPEELKRVAKSAGKSYFGRQDYASAVEYFEIAGEFEEAGRIRREFKVEESIRRLNDEELFKRCAPACVTLSSGHGTGSGFFIKRGGYILTNNHCVESASNLKVITADGKTFDAKVIATSEIPDLALVKVNLIENPVLKLGDSDSVRTGMPASTIGSPKGQPQSFTKGNISNVEREYLKNKCFQISVLINHGNSGGPLFDENGIVIGVCTFGEGTARVINGVSFGSDIQGMNYAIKINEAKKVFSSTLAF